MSQRKVRDAFYGAGVYMTAHGPEHGTEKILKNNYGEHVQKGKSDYYFKFSTKELLLLGVKCELDEGRIVWRFPKTLFINSVWFAHGKTGESQHLTASPQAIADCGGIRSIASPTARTYDSYSSNSQYETNSYHQPTNAPRQQQQQQEESGGPGLGTVLAVGAAATAIGVGLAALFGAFNRPNTRRQ